MVRVINLRGQWKFAIGNNELWAEPDFDDNSWENIRVPDTWEDNGFYGYDGFAWYRYKFDGSALDPGKTYWLLPGYIDDADVTYFNGKVIGKSGSFPPGFRTAYRAKRMYVIPPELINYDGLNTIAVQVYDGQLEGGITSGAVGIYTMPNSGLTKELSGMWKFRLGSLSRWVEADYEDEHWDDVLVPSPWEKQGYNYEDGRATYRKKVTFTASEARENWTLILGFIDDFDRTYFNGQLVGTTEDGRDYGFSRSFQELRVYGIPAHMIKEGENTIVVDVFDMGNVGGIYEGPVGLIRSEDLDDFPLYKYRRF